MKTDLTFIRLIQRKVLNEEQDCDRDKDYPADNCKKEVPLLAQGCTMFAIDLSLLQCLEALVESGDVSCCFLLFYTLHRRVVVCVKEASLLWA